MSGEIWSNAILRVLIFSIRSIFQEIVKTIKIPCSKVVPSRISKRHHFFNLKFSYFRIFQEIVKTINYSNSSKSIVTHHDHVFIIGSIQIKLLDIRTLEMEIGALTSTALISRRIRTYISNQQTGSSLKSVAKFTKIHTQVWATGTMDPDGVL